MSLEFLGVFRRKGSDGYETQETGAEFAVSDVNADVETDNALITDGDEGESGQAVYNKVARLAIYIGTFLLPIFLLPWTTSFLELNKQLLLLSFSGIALISWLLGIVSSGKLSWRGNNINWGVFVFAGAAVLASLFSVAPAKSVFGLANSLSGSLTVILSLSVFYLVAINVFDDKGESLIRVLSVSVFVALLYGLIQMLGLHLIGVSWMKTKAFNTVGSINSLGILGAIMLPIFSKFKPKEIWMGWIGRIGSVVSIAILIIINWWVLWLAAIVGMVALIVTGSVNQDRFKIARFLLPMTVIVLAVFLLVIDFNLAVVKGSFSVEVAPTQRLSWDIAVSVLKENFVFGYGLENFSLAFDKFGAGRISTSNLSSLRFFDSSSEFFNMAVHGGIVLVLAFLFFIGMVGWVIFGKLKSSQIGPKVEGVLASLTAAFTAMFFYPFNTVIMFVLYVLIALVILTLWGKERRVLILEETTALSLVSSLGFIGGLILVLVGAYFHSVMYIADIKYAQALTSTDNTRTIELMVDAVNLNGKDDRFFRSSSQVALNLLSDELRNGSPNNEKIQNYITSAASFARTAVDIAPKESLNWTNLGTVYQGLSGMVDGVDKLAEESYLEAARLRPGDPNFYNRIGNVYLTRYGLLLQFAAQDKANAANYSAAATQSLDKAEENFKKALELSPNYGVAIYNLGVVYDRQGKVGKAITEIEKLIPFNTNQPGLTFELGLLYYRNGQKDKAFNQLQRAVVLSPDYSNARWFLALIHEERKQLDQAIGQLERILNVEANKDNAAVLQKLEELKAGQVSIPPGNVLDQEPL